IKWKAFSQVAVTASAGIVVAVFTVIAAASFASLIFNGALDGLVPIGIRMALTTAVIVGAVVALTSSCQAVIAIPQDRVVPILALLAASIALRMPLASAEQKGMAVLSALVMVTLISGLFLFGLGRLRLGNLIRYIPFPVIGGFLAGSGWLLVLGGLRVMMGEPIHFAAAGNLFHAPQLWHWLPGLALGILLFWLSKRVKNQFFIPAMLPIGIGLFYVAIGLGGVS